jgi:hypothetical protein
MGFVVCGRVHERGMGRVRLRCTFGVGSVFTRLAFVPTLLFALFQLDSFALSYGHVDCDHLTKEISTEGADLLFNSKHFVKVAELLGYGFKENSNAGQQSICGERVVQYPDRKLRLSGLHDSASRRLVFIMPSSYKNRSICVLWIYPGSDINISIKPCVYQTRLDLLLFS